MTLRRTIWIVAAALVLGLALQTHGSPPTTRVAGVPQLNSMAYVNVAGKPFGLFGTKGFFLKGDAYDAAVLVWFLFMMVFMDTSATIPTGALAERWRFSSFATFSVLVGAFIYPIY